MIVRPDYSVPSLQGFLWAVIVDGEIVLLTLDYPSWVFQ